ncbi:MAG: LemA family protein [Tenericutes bacterium HGW-Tenericutes-6]|mgnify:CR=1 FL=1|jgi:LemA protein|nr:MAG: LemA family protein [Tenericutes bacterium HGW-Tenericutes-6]
MNNRSLVLVIGGVIFLFLVIIGISLIVGYNNLVDLDEDIQGKYAEVENRLQERHDKIGQVVDAVDGLQEYALSVYEAITAARAAYNAADSLEELIEADALTAAAFTDLLVVVEDNPNINVSSGYVALIDEISSMESALSVARRDYNESVQDYNASIRRFPRVLYASLFGFERTYEYWKLNDGADEVPVIDFND